MPMLTADAQQEVDTMTSAPSADGSTTGTPPGAEPGPGEPAQETGDDTGGARRQPEGYPEEVDPAEGPVSGRGRTARGDLEDPGAG